MTIREFLDLGEKLLANWRDVDIADWSHTITDNKDGTNVTLDDVLNEWFAFTDIEVRRRWDYDD